jgi:hypothetical protein
MKTKNYNIDLMVENQITKELIFNESIYKYDYLINRSAKAFAGALPESATEGDIYILPSNNGRSNIACFINNIWHHFSPQSGVIYYVSTEKGFYLLNERLEWENVTVSSSNNNNIARIESKVPIRGEYELPSGKIYYYLYLEGNCSIKLPAQAQEITIIIRQNITDVCSLEWFGNILWPNSSPFQVSSSLNSLQLIKFIPIACEGVYLAEISNQIYI